MIKITEKIKSSVFYKNISKNVNKKTKNEKIKSVVSACFIKNFY